MIEQTNSKLKSRLRWQLFAAWASVLVAVLVVVFLTLVARNRSLLFETEIEKLRPAARELAKACADHYMSPSDDQLRIRFAKIMKDFPDLSYVVYKDRNSAVHCSADSETIDSLKEKIARINPQPRDWNIVKAGRESYIDMGDLTPTRPPLPVHIGFATSLLSQRMRGLLLHQSGIALVALAAGLGGAFLLSVWLTRPVTELSGLAERMSLGDMDVRLRLKSKGEIGRVYRSLERLRESVLYALRRLDDKNESAEDDARSETPPQDKLAKGERRWPSAKQEAYMRESWSDF